MELKRIIPLICYMIGSFFFFLGSTIALLTGEWSLMNELEALNSIADSIEAIAIILLLWLFFWFLDKLLGDWRMSDIPNKNVQWPLPVKKLPKPVFCIQCCHYWPEERWCKQRHSSITRQFAREGRICREYEQLWKKVLPRNIWRKSSLMMCYASVNRRTRKVWCSHMIPKRIN